MRIVFADELDDSFFAAESLPEFAVVGEILAAVQKDGDVAVRRYTKLFDKLDPEIFSVSNSEIAQAKKLISKPVLEALEFAAKRIRTFSQRQFSQYKPFVLKEKGITLGQRIVPIQKVGCYVPGGRYPLPSTALMTIIPAKVAGVKEVIVCSPKIQPATIAACAIAGADRIFRIGGVQAIGAMAYGTAQVPKVDKIVGPGNAYVTCAKREVFGIVGIDMLAGPSEVLIIADETANPTFIAADMLAQAEHDPKARADLITTSAKLAKQVEQEITQQLSILPTEEAAKSALENSKLIVVKTLIDAITLANRRAPEHLEIQVKKPNPLVAQLTNYGSLFIGKYSAEVFGDYCSGTNHVLPTNGAARYTSGLSVREFLRLQTFQDIKAQGAKKLAKTSMVLSDIEGLFAHKQAAQVRIAK